MHRARVARAVDPTGRHGDRQGVHIRAQPDAAYAVAAAQRRDEPGPAQAVLHVVAEAGEDAAEMVRGRDLGEGGLGMPVQVVAPLLLTGARIGDQLGGHGVTPAG